MTKVLAVIPSLAKGGAERVVSWLTQEWERDHGVTVCVFNAGEHPYPVGGELVDLALPAQRSWLLKPVWMLRRAGALARLIRKTDPDHLVGFMETANIPLLLAALWTGRNRKLTLSVHNNPARFAWIFRFVMALLYRTAGDIVAVSGGVRDYLETHLYLPANRLRVIHNPLQLEEIRIKTDHAGSLGIAAGGRYLFAAGRLVPQKDFSRMLRIFSRIADSNHILIIAGEGPERERLASLVDSLGLSMRVKFIGRVENPFAWMARAEAFLLTSKYEGWGNVLAEAMACGCPVVAFDCDYGPKEITDDGRCGLLVPMDDEDAFVRQLMELLASPARREQLRALGRERARSFDVRALAPRWLNSGS